MPLVGGRRSNASAPTLGSLLTRPFSRSSRDATSRLLGVLPDVVVQTAALAATADASAFIGPTPSFVGSAATGGNLATLTPAWPAGLQSGDVALLVWSVQNTSSPTAPAGWTQIGSSTTAGSLTSLLFWRLLDGTESGTVSLTCGTINRQSANLVVQRGMDPTAPIDSFAVRAESATASTHPAPSVSTTTGDPVIWTFYGERSSSGTNDAVPGTGFVDRADSLTQGGGTGGTIAASAQEFPLVGRAIGTTVTPPDWTSGNGFAAPAVVTWTVALQRLSGASVTAGTVAQTSPVDATATASVSLGTSQTIPSDLAATGFASSSLTSSQTVPSAVSATGAATASLTSSQSVVKALSATGAATASLATTQSAPGALSATAGASASLVASQTLSKALVATAAASASVVQSQTVISPLSATGAASASIAASTTSAASATGAASASLVALVTHSSALSATGGATVSLAALATRIVALAATASATATVGVLVTRTVVLSATAAGTVTLSVTADGPSSYTPHIAVTATLVDGGSVTAVLSVHPADAALAQTAATATLALATVTAVLASDGTSTATLASNGVSTATLAAVVSTTAQVQTV